MGGKESLIKEYSQPGLKKFNQNFEFYKSIDDSKFGKIHVFSERKTKKHIALSDKFCHYTDKIDHFKSLITLHMNLKHPNFLRLVAYTRRAEEHLCSSQDVFTLFFEWYEHDLQQELLERAARKEYLEEGELWFLIKAIVSVGVFLESKQIYHGDIRPETIIMSEEGDVFLSDHAFINPCQDSWGKVERGSQDVYMSPEQLAEYRENLRNPEYDVYKADIFSFGMTLLYAMNLKNPVGAYDYHAKTINTEAIMAYKMVASQRYSQEMIDFVSLLLEFNPKNRPTFIDLQKELDQIEQNLNQKKSPTHLKESLNLNPSNGQREANVPYRTKTEPDSYYGGSSQKGNFKSNGVNIIGPHNYRKKY